MAHNVVRKPQFPLRKWQSFPSLRLCSDQTGALRAAYVCDQVNNFPNGVKAYLVRVTKLRLMIISRKDGEIGNINKVVGSI